MNATTSDWSPKPTASEIASLAVTLDSLKSAGRAIGRESGRIGHLARHLFSLFAELSSADSREKFNADLLTVYAALCKDAQRIVINNAKQCALQGRTDSGSPFQIDGRYVSYSAAKGAFSLSWQDVPAEPAKPAKPAEPAEPATAESTESAAKLRTAIEKPLKQKLTEAEAKIGKLQHALDAARGERDAAKAESTRLRSELNAAQRALAKASARADTADRTLASLKAKPTAMAV